MPTVKQRKAVERIVENRGNISRSMREVGYSEATAVNPKNLTESKGFKELCDELGLTDNLIAQALVDDIKSNRGKRVPELQLAAKLKGLLVERPDGGASQLPTPILTSLSINVNVNKDQPNARQEDGEYQAPESVRGIEAEGILEDESSEDQ